MKTYLVEAWSPDIEFDDNRLIVALTPKVCYQLDKAGIKYSIIEDYYDEVGLSADVDEYHKAQLRWIESLDEFLQNSIKELKELKLKLGTIYYYRLKTMVLDPLYIRCYTLNRLFEAVKSSSVTFISHPAKDTPLDFTLQSKGKSYYSQVIPILCRKKKIRLTSVFLEPSSKAVKEIKSTRSVSNLVNWLPGKLYRSATIRRMYFNWKYFSQRPFFKQKNGEGLNIFVLKLPYSMEMNLVIDAVRKGYNAYQLSDNSILKYFSLGARKILHLKTEYKDTVTDLRNDSIWENTASFLEGHDLIRWVNEKCQLDVSQIVLPKLKYLISRICPEILGYFKVFNKFYKNNKIDLVVASYGVTPVEFAAVAAANHYRHTTSVGICHGDSIFANKTWNITELSRFNIYITSNKELEEYFSYQCQANGFPIRLYTSSHRLLNVRKISYLREKQKGDIKERIVYLPTMLMGDNRRLDGATYPDTWYYKFQKSVIEYLSTKKEFTFVWKGLPPSDAIYNPIPNFIRDNNFSNIEVATNPFPEHLLSVDRVICDYPATGFYESVVAGVPTMCLYNRALIVRKSAVDYFGNLLKLFSDIPEAIEHIDQFLDSAPELYKATIDTEDNHILDILEEVSRKAT